MKTKWALLAIAALLFGISPDLFLWYASAHDVGCTGTTVVLGGEVASDPIVVNSPCPCIEWDASTGDLSHYHLRVDGELYIDTVTLINNAEVCLPTKNQTLAIDVYGVPLVGTAVSPVSTTTYIRWQDAATPTPVTPTPTPITPTPVTPTPPVICYEMQEVEVPCP